MHLLDHYKTSRDKARWRLVSKFHQLREVLRSDALSLSEKGRLFVEASDDLYQDAHLAYPDLPTEFKNGVHPRGERPHHCTVEALEAVIERLNQILEYRRHAAEFRILVDQISDIYYSDAGDERRKMIEPLVAPLLAAANGMGKHYEIVDCSHDGFRHRGLNDWFALIFKASESV